MRRSDEWAVMGVGGATLVIGLALVTAPQATVRPLRVTGHPQVLRAIGVADLALVPGLLCGRPRWPWMAGRALLNLPIAAYSAWLARHAGSTPAMGVAVGLIGLSVSDGTIARRLRARGHRQDA